MTLLGVDGTVVLVGGAFVLAAVVLVLLIAAPWKSVRDEPPLADDVEARLLLGEDPERIAADVDAADERRASVHDLDRARDDGD